MLQWLLRLRIVLQQCYETLGRKLSMKRTRYHVEYSYALLP